MRSSTRYWIILFCGAAVAFLASCSGDNMPKPNQANAFLKYYGGNGDQYASDVAVLDDGGFALFGESNSFTPTGLSDYFLVKTDNSGNELWSRTFDQAFLADRGVRMEILTDGFLLGGSALRADSVQKILLIKTDLQGNELWRSILKENDSSTESFKDFKPAIAGESGFIVVGTTTDVDIEKNDYDPLTDLQDFYTARISAEGNPIWEAIDGFANLDFGTNVEVFGNTYIVSGDAFIQDKNTRNLFMIRYNSIGLTIETVDFGDGINLKADDTYKTTDGGMVFLGTREGNNQLVFSKVSEALIPGSLVTLQTGSVYRGKGIIENSDGNLVITATETLSQTNQNIILLQTDLNGAINWTQSYGKTEDGNDVAGFLAVHPSGGYVMVGQFDLSTNLMAGLLRVNNQGRLLPE